jgi:hypothetical protein
VGLCGDRDEFYAVLESAEVTSPGEAPQYLSLSGDDPLPLPDAIRWPFFG